MKKSEFKSTVVSTLESLMIELLGDCYDVTSDAYSLVENMTLDNDIEWDKEDDSE